MDSSNTANLKKRIVIIGAGVGGTATAARLAKKGHSVTVLEKNGFNGGRCSLIHDGKGYRFDQGPSLLLMRKIFEDTFSDLKENMYDHLELLKCSPNYKLHFHDGQSMELSSDLETLITQVQRFEGNSAETSTNLLAFVSETGNHYHLSVAHALKKNYESFCDLITLKNMSLLWKLHIYDTVWGRACKYFRSEHIRKAFTFQTMYLGMSPFDAIAPYNLLQYTEIAEGIWYPRGGFNKVVQALETIAVKHEAKFRYDADVAQIKVNDQKEAVGVMLKDGEFIQADIVICNADLVYAYNHLLPKTKYGQKLGEKAALTSSSISFYWSMNTKINQLTTHNIFMAKDYKPSFDRIFKDLTLPEEPSFYVNVPSRIDPTAAPDGKDSIIVLVPVGHLDPSNPSQDITTLVDRARHHVITTLENRLGIVDFEKLIAHESHNNPHIWENKFNLWKGSILGLSHSLDQVLAFRPQTRSREFSNLYFVGASAQPGTGVPVVLCGAKLVADQVEADLIGRKGRNVFAPCFVMLFVLLIIVMLLLTL